MQKRRMHTKAFKLKAVRLLKRGDKTAANLAQGLNVRRNQLYKWKEQLPGRGESAFPGHGRRERVPSRRAETNQRLPKRIRTVHRASRENHGEQKTLEALRAAGEPCGRHRVARLRREHGILAKRYAAFADRDFNDLVHAGRLKWFEWS